jgi:hypothetical protein
MIKQLTYMVLLLMGLTLAQDVCAQAGAGMKLGPREKTYKDSIMNSNYKWIFPIWGQRLSRKGFDLQYPLGVGLNPYIGSQKVSISDLQVGVNGRTPVPLDFIKFGEVKASVSSITVRPDIWIFPFLDVYAIGGATFTRTNVNVAQPVQFSTEAKFNGSTWGFGTTLAGGYHGMITIIDLNHTWSFLGNIQGSVQGTMFTPRLGMSFPFEEHPNRSIAVWVGASGFFVGRTTQGTVSLNSLNPNGNKGDMQNIVDSVSAWYQGLKPAQQYVVKQIAQHVLDKINGLKPVDLSIQYSLKKRPISNWSMVAGAQYQISHTWQIRAEAGFLGGRQAFLLSGNFRFRR